MKKSLHVLLLALILALVPVLLTACGHTHTYKEEWSADGSHHWHEGSCEHEKAADAAPIKDMTTHTMGEPVEVAPTCGEAGSITEACTVCGYEKVTILPATGEHNFDKSQTVYNTEGEMIYARHKCTICGTLTGNEASYESKWTTTETHHWHKAKDTEKNEDLAYGAHEWGETTKENPTCGEDGSSTRRCKICNYADVTVLPATEEHTYTKGNFVYKAVKGVLYLDKTCDACKKTQRYDVPNSYVATNAAEAQAALDNATEIVIPGDEEKDITIGAIVYLTKQTASYGTLILNHDAKNVTILAAEGAKVDGIVIGATEAITVEALTVRGITFTGAADALTIKANVTLDGLTVDTCKMTDNANDSSFLLSATTSLKNLTVKSCTINGALYGISLNGAEGLTIDSNSFRNMTKECILLAANDASYKGSILINKNRANTIANRFLLASGIEGTMKISSNGIQAYSGNDENVINVTDATGTITATGNILPDGKTETYPTPEAAE